MYSLTCINVIVVVINLLVIMMGVTAAPIPKSLLIKTTATTLLQKENCQHYQQHHTQQQQHHHQHPHQNAALSAALSTGVVASGASSQSALPPASSLSVNNNSSLRLRKRHRKRHSIWYDYNNYNENSTILEWSNPCGGVFDPNAKQTKRPTRKEQKRIYNILRNTAINDYNRLNSTHQQDIEISNIEIWWLHNYTYKFLPKLKMNSSIALKRWYRNMQTYVASFAYLRRIQLKWDHSKSQRESNTSAELKELLKSSRNMLCELEAAVNKTHPYKQRRADRHIRHITRTEMNKRLKLRTKQRMDRSPYDLQEADSIDLKFVKFHYFEYLRNMWQILRKFNKRRGQVAIKNNYTQTGMEQQRPSSNINTQYNEIEKTSFGKTQATRVKKRKNSRTKRKLA